MTRKHFVELARALAEQKPAEHWNLNKMVQWELDCVAVARAGERANPRFSPLTFLAACGVEGRA